MVICLILNIQAVTSAWFIAKHYFFFKINTANMFNSIEVHLKIETPHNKSSLNTCLLSHKPSK